MSTAVSALPRCVALRSKHDKSYLRSVHDENHGGSVIELGNGGIMNPRCRFYLEPSEKHEGLLHVRCCYNNKYWVPQQRVLPGHGGSARSRWVIGTAHEPEEDLSKPSCTLHKLIPIAGEQAEDGSTCRFLHSKLGNYVCTVSTTSMRSYMHIASHEDDEADRPNDGDGLIIDAFIVIDVSRQKQLPSQLVFKSCDNGRFLAGKLHPWWDEKTFKSLQFIGQDIGDPRVLHTTFTDDDGVVRIKSNYFDLFWRCGPYWVFADSDDTTYNNPNTLFRVITGDDFFALLHLGTNRFCEIFSNDFLTSSFNAHAESITNEARLQCSEPVLSREMYNVDFRLSEAKMYSTGIDGISGQTVKNHTSVPNPTKLTFKWTHTVESKWSSTVSMKVCIDTTIKTGVPFFAEGEIDIGTEFSGEYTWGGAETKTMEVTREISVDVPPKTKVTVRGIGSNGVCNIPFSYTQKDVLFNGKEVVQEFTDGMYFGIKTSDVTFETKEEPLSDDED